jgi:hypothetical protein
LYFRVLFFPQVVHHLVELLGYVEPIHHQPAIGQQVIADRAVDLPHVHAMRFHSRPLLGREFSHALLGRHGVAALRHRQHLR